VHMLVTPMDDGDISRMMQSLGCKYVRYFNSAYQRTGTLWEFMQVNTRGLASKDLCLNWT